MSLILEALKKSDAERRLSTKDQQLSPTAGQKRQRSSPARLIMLLAAIAGISAIGWQLWRQSSESEFTTSTPDAQSTPSVADASAPNEIPTALVELDLEADELATPGQTETETLPDSDSTALSLPDRARLQSSIAAVDPLAEPVIKPVVEPERLEPIATSEPLLGGQDLPAPLPLAARDDFAAKNAEPKNKTLPTFAQLPSALQSEIGDLTLNVLVFAEQAADRFVLINLRRYNHGQQLTDQLVVAEIRADGVVLDYAGRLFLLDTHF